MKRKIRLAVMGIALLTVLLWAFIALAGSSFGEKQAVTEAAVQIFAGELVGCGVIYEVQEEMLWIVTAGHVLERADGSVLVNFRNGQAAECNSYEIVEDADLAFLQIPTAALSFGKEGSKLWDEQAWNETGYKAVTVDKSSYDALKAGEKIIIAGFESAESESSECEGHISDKLSEAEILEPWIYTEDFSQYMLLAQGEASQGMSGAGVFDKEGHFIGILCGGNEDGELAILPLVIIEAKYAEQAGA